MQSTRPDLMYDVNHISIHAYYPSSADFQGISNLYTTQLSNHIIPSCISLVLMVLPPITPIKGFPMATFILKIYPTSFSILQMEEKATPPMINAPYSASSSVFFVLLFNGNTKTNQYFQPIPQTQKLAHFTYPQKRPNESDPSYKTLASKSSIL